MSVFDSCFVGMFLLARLILDNLVDQDNLEDLEEELRNDKLPRGIDEAYGFSHAFILIAILSDPVMAASCYDSVKARQIEVEHELSVYWNCSLQLGTRSRYLKFKERFQ